MGQDQEIRQLRERLDIVEKQLQQPRGSAILRFIVGFVVVFFLMMIIIGVVHFITTS